MIGRIVKRVQGYKIPEKKERKNVKIHKTLALPPTLNETYGIGGKRLYKKPQAVAWQEEVGWGLKTKETLLGRVSVEITMFLKYDRDIDSSLKLVLDTMERVGVYKNDKQITDLRVGKRRDKTNPRMEIGIKEL